MLKKQRTIKKRLEKELSERCYQIGIPAMEEPKVCWNREQFRWYWGKKDRRKDYIGRASFRANAILIDLNYHLELKHDFAQIRNTLIHELVHMRWQHQPHGKVFKELIERILKGEVFPIRTRPSKYYPTYI
jgi:predicted SprT family Zn-dependent metalloprotease